MWTLQLESMTSDLQTIVLLSCSLTLWLSYLPWSVLRLAQIDSETSKQHVITASNKPSRFLFQKRSPSSVQRERKDRKTHKFPKTREMHLIVQKNTHTSFSIDFSQGSAMFHFWQGWKWGCEGLKYSAFNGLHYCLITIPNQNFQ